MGQTADSLIEVTRSSRHFQKGHMTRGIFREGSELSVHETEASTCSALLHRVQRGQKPSPESLVFGCKGFQTERQSRDTNPSQSVG